MRKIYTVILVLIFAVLAVSCENNNNNGNDYVQPEEKFSYTVKVFTLELQPVIDFEFIDNSGKLIGKTNSEGVFDIEINQNKFFIDVNQPNNQHDKSLNIDFMKPKNSAYKYIPFGYFIHDENIDTIRRYIVYYIDDINSENQLIEENFVEFGGPIVLAPDNYLTDTFVTFKLNGKIIGYSERNENVNQSVYLFRQVFKGSLITVHYETESQELDYILNDFFEKIPLGNSVRITEKLLGYKMRMVLKDKNK